jgi:hypothetical protein
MRRDRGEKLPAGEDLERQASMGNNVQPGSVFHRVTVEETAAGPNLRS